MTVISSRNNKSVNSAKTMVYAQSIAIPLMSQFVVVTSKGMLI